jgi:TetR/AcrR family transcriptional regulator, transcriptional repressor for nem operon
MGRVSDGKEKLMDAVRELIWSGSYGSTTIDQICEKAGVKKGSFYYFFDSKSDVAAIAIEADWQRRRPELDTLFSPTVPPLERLQKYCDYAYRFQAEIKEKFGRVLGCPQFCLGSEISTTENRLQKCISEILEQKRKYLESAIRDAHSEGLINAPDAASKSRCLSAYLEGVLTQARIQDNLEIIREAARGIFDFLGVKQLEVASDKSAR